MKKVTPQITVTSNASSVVFSLPPDYNKTLDYTGNVSSCSLSMSGIKDFAVNAKISTSTVLLPSGWPAYDMLNSDYSYINNPQNGASFNLRGRKGELQCIR